MWLDHITSSCLGFDEHVDIRKDTRYVPTFSPTTGSIPCEATERERGATITGWTATLHPLPGDHSGVEPPDPIPNSEVKRTRADGSVAQAMRE